MSETKHILILGIGNILMGDEGIGSAVISTLETQPLPDNVVCLDGGTGGFHLLGPMMDADKIILIDATLDGNRPGTVTRLQPKFATDYPTTLTAHDIGLKDILESLYLVDPFPERVPEKVILYAVSVSQIGEPIIALSAPVEKIIPELVSKIHHEVITLTGTLSLA